ncbi:MAG TPA: hypothetical protein DCF68_06715, partial [Cyanothece sp. UBA12306]|nr:hypothetical protein [Cyanothece sp. UBA12306]
MQEILYLEIPTPDTTKVCNWLQNQWTPQVGQKVNTSRGIRLQISDKNSSSDSSITETELSIF